MGKNANFDVFIHLCIPESFHIIVGNKTFSFLELSHIHLSEMLKVSWKRILVGASVTNLVVSFFIGDYYYLYTSFTIFLTFILLFFKSLHLRFLVGFLFCYYVIPLPNISTYRGTITYETLVVYSLFIFLIIAPSFFRLGDGFFQEKKNPFQINKILKLFLFFHLILVYGLLFYVYMKVGNILYNQELRFGLNSFISYGIKSSIYIPLIYPYVRNRSSIKFIYYVLIPVIPALMIGSRGTVISVFIGYAILLLLKNLEYGDLFQGRNIRDWKKYRSLFVKMGIACFMIISVFYFSRRYYSDVLISAKEVLRFYEFPSDSDFYLLISPFYLSFRETVGITNSLITNQSQNEYLPYPLFIAELLTPLPGEQQAPGRVLGENIIGAKLSGGLTPGLLGGLYLDFGFFALVFAPFFGILMKQVLVRAKYSDYHKILYSLTFIQFLHLFHRGFMKPEYIFSYVIIVTYFIINRFSIKSGQ